MLTLLFRKVMMILSFVKSLLFIIDIFYLPGEPISLYPLS